MFDADGGRRKLIVFTEHRDTLNYLVDRLRDVPRRAEAVVAHPGGTPREERRAIQERFTQDPDCLVLVATDAAGEGINLQRAHLVDQLRPAVEPEPHRAALRPGPPHRPDRGLPHVEPRRRGHPRGAGVPAAARQDRRAARRAYKGQVFDVLGEAIRGAELRELLIEAIRYGDRPDVRGAHRPR